MEEPEIIIQENWFEDYKLWLEKANEYALNTIRNYCIIVEDLLKENEFLDSKVLKSFITTGKNRRMKIAAVNNFKEFLLDEYDIEFKRYRLPRLKINKKIIKPLSLGDIEKLIEKMPDGYKLITELLYESGMRVSEIFRVMVEDFSWEDWEKNTSDLIELKITKSKRDKERIIFLSSNMARKIADYINDYRQDPNCNLLFDLGAITYRIYIRRTIKKLKLTTQTKDEKEKAQKIANYRYISKSCDYFSSLIKIAGKQALNLDVHSHLLRHSRICFLNEKGMPLSSIRDYAGHASLSTTNQYIHVNTKILKESMKKIINQ